MLDGPEDPFYTVRPWPPHSPTLMIFPIRFTPTKLVLQRAIFGLVGPLIALIAVGCATTPQSPPPARAGELPKVVSPDGRKPGFTRCLQTAPDTYVMQTGYQVFRPVSGRGPEVALLGAVHIGEPAYYRELQRRMDAADAVLYEMVIDESKPPSSLTPEEKAAKQEASAYARLARMMGLCQQSTHVRYDRDHYLRCDMSIQQMRALLESEVAAGGKTARDAKQALADFRMLYRVLHGDSWLINFAFWVADKSPALKTRLKFGLVANAANAGDKGGISPRLAKLINEDRNHHVMRELDRLIRERPDVKRFLIFYGSAHLPGMQQQLRALGYTPSRPVEWIGAVTCHPYAEGLGRKQVEAVIDP